MEFMCLDKYIFTMDLPEIQFFMCSACLNPIPNMSLFLFRAKDQSGKCQDTVCICGYIPTEINSLYRKKPQGYLSKNKFYKL